MALTPNMKKTILFFSLLALAGTLGAQALPELWNRSFKAQGKNSDRIQVLETDAAGNVYCAGYSGGYGGQPDMFAMKRGPQGDTLWTYTYEGPGQGSDYVYDMAIDATGNVYLTGSSVDAPTFFDMITTIKLNANGVEQWVRRNPTGGSGDSEGNAIAVDANGNVYVGGWQDLNPGSQDWLMVKYNAAGVLQWTDVVNGPVAGFDERVYDLLIAPNGNPTACGMIWCTNPSGGRNGFVKQYSPAGATVWTDTINNSLTNGTEQAYRIKVLGANTLIVAGETNVFNGSSRDPFVVSYNLSGTRNWYTVYTDAGSAIDEWVYDMCVDDSGNVYTVGTTFLNGRITRFNSNGTTGWKRNWVSPVNGYNVLWGVRNDDNGNVYVTGRCVYAGPDYYGNNGLGNAVISKYSALGDSLWSVRIADSSDVSMPFSLDYRDGKLFAGGFKTDTAYVDENLMTLIVDTSGNRIGEWIYNGDGDAIARGQVVRSDAQNNVYCAATTDRLYGEGKDVTIVKYDPAGNLLWERYYTTPGWNNDTLTHMEFDPSGNLVLVVSSDTGKIESNYRLSLVRMNTNGNFLDTNWYLPVIPENVLAKNIAIRSDGSVAVAALSNLQGGVLVYFDPAGNVSWTAKLDSTPFTATKINSVATFPNGDLAVAGQVQPSSGTTAKGVVQRFTASGQRLWSTDIDSANVADELRDVTVSTAGQVAVTGSSGTVSILCSLDGSTGALSWRQVYNPNTTNEFGVKVRFTSTGNIAYICRGWTGFVARWFTLQYSGAGVFQWANTYSQTASDREPVDMLIDGNNRVVAAGWRIDATSINYNYVLIGYSPAGVLQFENTWSDNSGTGNNPDQLRSLTRDAVGNFIVTGESATTFLNNFLFRMVTIKYGPSAAGVEETEFTLADNVYAYPNPSADGLFSIMDATSSNPIVEGAVYDLQGREVSSYDYTREAIRLNQQPAGLYIFRYVRAGGQTGSMRLMRQ
jgi:hypothetical protein